MITKISFESSNTLHGVLILKTLYSFPIINTRPLLSLEKQAANRIPEKKKKLQPQSNVAEKLNES